MQQTQSRAVLSWDSFNVGAATTLTFDQQGNADWVALNRVVGASASPSQILGTIKADGTVLVINQNGIIFGAGAQVNVHSLIASTLEIGRSVDGSVQRTIEQRNAEFLQYGLTGYSETYSTNGLSATVLSSTTNPATAPSDAAVSVQKGAIITSGSGGMILLAAPNVSNAGWLAAADGQVSLAGTLTTGVVTLQASSGSSTSADPYVRGYLVASSYGNVVNSGLIEADRGYVSLGNSGASTINSGILASTTAVSANGTIDVLGRTISLAPGSTIVVAPDQNGETIPQDAQSVAAFKTSQVRIGSYNSNVTMQSGATILAPSGNVTIGQAAGAALIDASQSTIYTPASTTKPVYVAGSIVIESGATIDVSGLKDVSVPLSSYNLSILLKGNELADSGGYQTGFLNGTRIWIDARKSGVRSDGVAWIGSPLISASAYYDAVGVTAAQLMTKGGNVVLGTNGGVSSLTVGAPASVRVAAGATIDISGGWVTYAAGMVRTSRLVTNDGRIVSIDQASLYDTYVAVAGSGFVVPHAHWGMPEIYASSRFSGTYYQSAYVEGRDAGTLTVKTAQAILEGALNGQAYPGQLQSSDGQVGTGTSSVYGDQRAVQAVNSQLPAGGLLFIQQLGSSGSAGTTGGGDIKVVAAADYAREDGSTILSDALLSQSGLAQVSLWTSGSIKITPTAKLSVLPGGVIDLYSGRSITIAGTVTAPSGKILIETAGLGAGGSVFTTADDARVSGMFDVSVTGSLSVAGLWVNDYGKADQDVAGSAYLNGGSIAIVSAPSMSDQPLYDITGATTTSTDVSGSILLANAKLIDVSAGGWIKNAGKFDLSGKGGNLALIDQTSFFQLKNVIYGSDVAYSYFGELSGLRARYQYTAGYSANTPINPSAVTSTVQFNPDVIKAAGFAGGGTFTLWSPDVRFGSGSADDTALATAVPLDFFQKGFATYNITSYKTKLTPNNFVDASGIGLGGNNALLQTQTYSVKSGETLLLSQALLPTILSGAQTQALSALPTGGSVSSVLTASVPTEVWDQKPVNLKLDGMVELEIEPGGRISAAPGATLTVAKLLNNGTIRLPGGSIVQSQTLPEAFQGVATIYAVRSLSDVFTLQGNGSIVETAASQVAGLTNAKLAMTAMVYLLGELGASDGIVLAPGSVTDLSGASVLNPRAIDPGTSAPVRSGKLYDAGSITLASALTKSSGFYRTSYLSTQQLSIGSFQPGLRLTIAAGSEVDLNGVTDSYLTTQATGNVGADGLLSHRSALTILDLSSAAGAITAPNGFTISSDAILRAFGGSDGAEGGSLTLADPILTQSVADAANKLSADQITAAGFTTLTALGSLNSLGPVALTLGRALVVQSRPWDSGTITALPDSANTNAVVIKAGGDISVTAPYIGLASSMDVLSNKTAGTAASYTVTLHATDAFDVTGAVLFDRSVANTRLVSDGDLRLTGVPDYKISYLGYTTNVGNNLTALLAVNGDLAITAAQLYPTTGTTATITTQKAAGLIGFARAGTVLPSAPYSAGANLTVSAESIVQGGVIRVPLGSLTLAATGNLTLTDESYTEVSANGLIIPYGTTTDGKEWYFTPTGSDALSAPPAKLLTLTGTNIKISAGAIVNISGGGDVSAYEFSAGTGGSRDVLNSLNSDTYTSKNGCTYAGCAQAYAIVPGLSASPVAAYDPVYSSNYATLTSRSGVGSRVQIDIGDGLKWYTLLPAQYATLPGGVLVVEQTASTTLALGSAAQRADGTLLSVGTYGNALSGSAQSATRLFAVQSQDVFKKYSSIKLTTGNAYFTALAKDANKTVPALPIDAGQLVLNASSTLAIDAALQSSAATGGRGAKVDIGGSAISIVSALPASPPAGVLTIAASSLTNLGAESLLIGAIRTENSDGTTALSVKAGSITVANDAAHPVSASEIVLASTGSIVLADGAAFVATGDMTDTRSGTYAIGAANTSGTGALLRVANGSERLTSRTNFTTAGSLRVGAATLDGRAVMLDSSGTMSLSNQLALRHANYVAVGANRIGLGITDPNYAGVVVTPEMQALLTQTGGQLTLRSQSSIDFANGIYTFGAVKFDASILAGTQGGAVTITADTVTLGNSGTSGYVCSGCAANAGTLDIEANEILYSRGLMATRATTITKAVSSKLLYDVYVTLPAGTIVSGNTVLQQDTVVVIAAGTTVSLPIGTGLITPTAAPSSLSSATEVTIPSTTITLSGTTVAIANLSYYTYQGSTQVLSYGPNQKVTLPTSFKVTLPSGITTTTSAATTTATTNYFAGGVTLAASKGMYVTGQNAGFDAGTAALTLHTPYLGDKAQSSGIVPDLTLATAGSLRFDNPYAVAAANLAGIPGTSLTLSGATVAIDRTMLHAAGGAISITGQNGIILSNGASIAAPGWTGTYGDSTDSTTATSAGGTIKLTAVAGDITLGGGSVLSVASTAGDGGKLQLSAAAGNVVFGGTISGSGGAGSQGGIFSLEAFGAVDLVALDNQVGAYGFTGGFQLHSHSGDIVLAAGQRLKSGSVVLTADGGVVRIEGIIDTAGTNGGDIELWGNKGVTLASGAVLDAHADGYADNDPRQAKAGDVTLGTDFIAGTTSINTDGAYSGTSGTITVAAGATLDLSARRTANRAIPLESGLGYYYVAGDSGGTLRLRAPVYKDGGGHQTVDVNVASASSVKGAKAVVLEGFRRWDLATVVTSGNYTGVTGSSAAVTLDVSASMDTWTTTCTSAGSCTLGATVVTGLNFLSDRDWTGTHETVVSFVQDLDLSASYTKLGGLASLKNAAGSSIFSVSPGVDLTNAGSITLNSNWNLAAGAVDVTSAIAAGLMANDPAQGKPYVLSGKEDALLTSYTAMIYRAGGRLSSGAPTLDLRAGGSLAIGSSSKSYRISDGTFQFQDTSSTTYQALANAGAGGLYEPSVYVSCNVSCSNKYSPLVTTAWVYNSDWTTGSTNYLVMNLGLSTASYDAYNMYQMPGSYSAKPIAPPYTASANSPAATGTGNAFENTVPFPTGFGSTTFRLIAGADLASSSPKGVLQTSTASLTFAGTLLSYSYSKGASSISYDTSKILIGATDATYSKGLFATDDADAFLSQFLAQYPTATRDTSIYVYWASYNASDTSAAYYKYAKDYYDWLVANGGSNYFIYQQSASKPFGSGATMPLWLAVQLYAEALAPNWQSFLNYSGTTYTKYSVPSGSTTTGGTTVTVSSNNFIRTGSGDIVVASANKIDISNGVTATQTIPAVEIYTFGQRATIQTAIATDVMTGGHVTVDLTSKQTTGALYLTNGGDISISAGSDVLGRSGSILNGTTGSGTVTGSETSLSPTWLPGAIDFTGLTSGFAALAGGDITISAGRDVTDIPALATSATRTVTLMLGDGSIVNGVQFLGDSNISVRAGRDIAGGVYDVTSGNVVLSAARDIAPAAGRTIGIDRTTRMRMLNAEAIVQAARNASLNWAGALPGLGSGNWLTPVSSLAITAGGNVTFETLRTADLYSADGSVVPGDLRLTALTGNLNFANSNTTAVPFLFMEPVATGNLVLLAGGAIGSVTISMEDSDPADLFGPFYTKAYYSWAGSAGTSLRSLIFPVVTSKTTEAWLRLYHSSAITHLGDTNPVFIAAGGNISGLTLSAPKQARIVSGGDIVNMAFFGQNLAETDVTRIAAAGDITATSALLKNTVGGQTAVTRPTLLGNVFVIGGPGSFFLEAGGDIGPFLNSANVTLRTGNINDGYIYTNYTYAGGVRSVGWDWNPWLKPVVQAAGGGADLYLMFGLGAIGPDYAGFAERYVDPANAAALTYGGYGSALTEWMKARYAARLIAAYGTTNVSEAQAYAAYLGLPAVDQHVFLLSQVYFNELEQVALTTSPSYMKYSRGYEAVNALFPAAHGFTANGLQGGAVDTARIHTGDLDLRLATLQTTRGGDIRLLGPGGDVIAGSVVRTSTQAARRNYVTDIYRGMAGGSAVTAANLTVSAINSIPTAYEGILTMRGGSVSSFTDGSLVLNQSRLFTQGGGDILAWSSNGDLNAGQGPKTSANFPPIAVKFGWDLFGEVDKEAGVSGAGIAAFLPAVGAEAPDVYLLAPRGTVDAGDAGVRVAGNLSIVAYQVRNADNFQVGGAVTGITLQGTSAPLTVTEPKDKSTTDVAKDAIGQSGATQPNSVIIVEFLGFGGGDGDRAPKDEEERRRRSSDRGYNLGSPVQVVGAGTLNALGERYLTEEEKTALRRR